MARPLRLLIPIGCVLVFGNNLFAAAGGTCPSSVPSGITSCFFADYTNGSDANNGTSETTPLKHFPGMAGCSGNCNSISPAAGEGFILRGGITWPAAALPWSWNWSGSSTGSTPGCTGSGCIYIGVDPAWYTGYSWARPILNGGGASGIPNKSILNIGEPDNYLIFDNLELTGFYWSGSPSYGTSIVSLPAGSPNTGAHDTFEHLYIHGWSHGSFGSGTREIPCGITGDTANVNNNAGSILEYSVVDGSDTDQQSCNGAVFGGPPYIAYNEFKYVTSCMIVDGIVTVHDNICENIPTTFDTSPAHQNGLEINYDGQNHTIYNNVFRHIALGALVVWLAPDGGHTAYFFNNVIYDTNTGGQDLDLAASLSLTTGTDILWNNTVECGPDSGPPANVCVGNIASAVTAVTLQNNQFITNNSSYWSTRGPTPTLANNVLQSKATANAAGYAASETYAFAPTASTAPTVGAGVSAATLCVESGAGTPCQQSTTYGIVYNSVNHTVSTPGLTPEVWNSAADVGAYSFGAGSTASRPAPPQNVKAVVQ